MPYAFSVAVGPTDLEVCSLWHSLASALLGGISTCVPSQGQVKYHPVGACHMMAVGAYLVFRGFAHLIQQAMDHSFVIDIVTLCVWLGPA